MKKTNKQKASGQLIFDDLTFIQLILPMNNNIYCSESSGTKYNRNQQKMAKSKGRKEGHSVETWLLFNFPSEITGKSKNVLSSILIP